MIRIKTDNELFDIDTHDITTAFATARAVRPVARDVRVINHGPNARPDDADTTLYTGDLVAHFAHPGETGEIVETEVPRSGLRIHWVEWPGGFDSVAYFADSLIRVTKLES